jgi:hypothetical protein
MAGGPGIKTAFAATILFAAASTQQARAESAGEPDSVAQAAGAVTVTAASHAQRIDGIWIFDAKRSDDPRKVMESLRPAGGGGGGRGGGGGGWGGGGGRRGGGGGGGGGWGGGGGGYGGGGGDGGRPAGETADGERRPPGANAMERVMRPAQKVVIDLEANQVTVAEDERAPRPYALGDSLDAHKRDLVTEGTTARWKGGRLEMTQEMGARGKLVESYELSKDGATLTIRAHREGGREGMPNPTISRVYTRYEGD